jgi:class 3 adenylate cyclase/predicted ATPase
MISCPSCNTESPEKANFCLNCGKPLKSISNNQNLKDIEPGVPSETMTRALKRLMPTSYVEKLLSGSGKLDGERRVVTILFSDVKGSTALSENLDPEEVLEIMNGAFNVLIEPINRYEGTLARLMGDAILAFFGAPVAHEDDPYRACRAALDILAGAKEFSKKLEVERGIKGFGVRVGINTGLVVVAEVGNNLRVEYTAMGDAVNVAARMESAAEPGTILITEATKKLVQNYFELVTTGPIQVKGKSRPINTYRVQGIKNQAGLLQKTTKYRSALVGRELEIKEIDTALFELQRGTGCIISVIGDRGIGKSRLVAEVSNKKPVGLKWAEGGALSCTVNRSYWIARSLIKNYFGYYQETLDDNMLKVIQNKIENHFGEKTSEIFPYLEYFLKDYIDDEYTRKIKFSDLSAVKGQFHFAFKELIKKESLLQPIVLMWEDLQWGDLSSLELLNEMLPLAIEYPVLFLLQYRLEETENRMWNFHHNNLNEYKDKHKIILLRQLEDSEGVQLIKSLAGSHEISSEILNQVINKSEGNPSFIEELIISLLEQSDSVPANQPSEIVGSKTILRLPDSLQNVIMSRVDCLEQKDKITLQTAAVIGRVFSQKLLAKVLEDSFTQSEVTKSLNELQVRELILRHLLSNISSDKLIFQKEYIFKQDITQNVLYNSILLSQRQNLHRKIGEEIENIYHESLEEFANSLALHFERGNDVNKAIHYNKVAADKAKELFANEDALFYYSRALDLSKNSSVDQIEFANINESIADIYFITAKYSISLKHYTSSLAYYKDAAVLGRVYYKCGKVLERWGNYVMALEKYNKALRIINNDEEKILSAHIYSEMGMVYYRQGDFKLAEKLISKASLISKAVGTDKDIADVYNYLGIIYSKLGELEKSMWFHNKCLNIMEKYGVSGGLAAAYNNIGYLFQLNNDLENAIENYNKSLEYCEKTGNLHGLSRTYDNLSQIFATQGKNELAQEFNLKAISLLGKIADGEQQINPDLWLQSGVW